MNRRQTTAVKVGGFTVGGTGPVVVQSMTNTPTSDVDATVKQTLELARAGSELVRMTVNDDDAARAVPEISARLKAEGCNVGLIGDFHYNGHLLLPKFPEMAKTLDKYRINPGNVGSPETGPKNFDTIVRVAAAHEKPVRIGVNWGSLSTDYVDAKIEANNKRAAPFEYPELVIESMVDCALESAERAQKCGLGADKIILSVKMSQAPAMIEAYRRLAERCSYALHLGLTEAGGGVKGTVASTAALAVLLEEGIGDTIRVSLTPEPGAGRTKEVAVCRELLQALELRFFQPTVISCPGCGRTDDERFRELVSRVSAYIDSKADDWVRAWPDAAKLQVAVMGCIVNGPGEGKHADIGISFPGRGEEPMAIVFEGGRQKAVLKEPDICGQFFTMLMS